MSLSRPLPFMYFDHAIYLIPLSAHLMRKEKIFNTCPIPHQIVKIPSGLIFLVDRLELENQALKNLVRTLKNDYTCVIYKENRSERP